MAVNNIEYAIYAQLDLGIKRQRQLNQSIIAQHKYEDKIGRK